MKRFRACFWATGSVALLTALTRLAGLPATESDAVAPVSVWDSPLPRTLLPCDSQNTSESPVSNLIFNNLIRAGYTGTLQPELANYWEISSDRREYTFTLRPGICFHDGRRFTADDVIFTLKLIIRRIGASTPEVMLIDGASEYLEGRSPEVRGLARLGDLRFRIRLVHPFKYFLHLLAHESMAIVPRDLAGRSESDFRLRPIGTGPFRLSGIREKVVKHKRFTCYRFERHPGYFEPTGNVRAIDYCFSNQIIDSETRLAFDIFPISLGEVEGIRREGTRQTINSNFNNLDFLILNSSETPRLADPQVRRMINYSINREALVERVLNRQAMPAHSMIPSGLLGHNPYYRLDYARAADLHDRLGSEEIAFSIITSPRDRRPEVAAFIRDQLRPLGCRVTVLVEPDQFQFLNRTIFETHSSVLVGASADYPAAFNFLSQLTEKKGLYNLFSLDLPEYVQRLRRLPLMDTPEEVRELGRIDRRFEADSLYIPLYYYSDYFAVSRRLRSCSFIFGEIIDFSRLEVSDE